MRGGKLFLLAVAGLAAFVLVAGAAFSQEAPRISKEEFNKMLGNPDVVLIDVRQATDWDASTVKIKGAVREEPGKAASWMDKYPKNKTLVLYCA